MPKLKEENKEKSVASNVTMLPSEWQKVDVERKKRGNLSRSAFIRMAIMALVNEEI